MAVQPPPGLDPVLSLLGVRFPSIDEDQLRLLADQLEKFAEGLDGAQTAADAQLAQLYEVYRGWSAGKLAELWITVTGYSGLIAETCRTVARVLRAAAVVVEVAKTQLITQLIAVQAQLARVSARGSWRAAAVLRLGRKIVNQLLAAAADRLARTVARPIDDMVDKVAQRIPPAPVGGSDRSDGQSFDIDLGQLRSCAAGLRRGADDIESKGLDLRRTVQGLTTGEPSDPFGELAIEATEKILRAITDDALGRILTSFRDTAARMDRLAGILTEDEDSNRMSLNSLSITVTDRLRPSPFSDSGLSRGGSSAAGLAAAVPRYSPVGYLRRPGTDTSALTWDSPYGEDAAPRAARPPEHVRDHVRRLLDTDLTALGALDEASLEAVADTVDRGLAELLERLDRLPVPTNGTLGDDPTERPTGEHRG
ncbi:WXG100-like domain-containing protein [Kitasatospora griseola]|uniref:WXG100-like domain-containing protein n=1 Tax=Kitasatospora griseola TaxID=2064 RepID=UPI0036465F2C